MPKYQFRDGTPYEGPTIKTPDGRILSGATYTKDSRRLVEVQDGGERSRELHKTEDEKKPVPKNKVGKQGRSKRSVVRKKSSNVSKAVQS